MKGHELLVGMGHAKDVLVEAVWFSGSVFLLIVTYVVFAAGSDYDGTVAPQVFIFSSDVRIITFQLPLIDDNTFEISENLTACLSFPGPMPPPRASIGPDTPDIIIVDEDSKYLSGSSVCNCYHFICCLCIYFQFWSFHLTLMSTIPVKVQWMEMSHSLSL
jgi:hypothetical protein